MELYDLIPLGFERTLNFTQGTETQTGKLVISRIEFIPKRSCFACYWRLDFIVAVERRLYGTDPLDCLMNVLWMAGELVRESGYPSLQVWWKEIGDHGGLPQIDGAMFATRKAPPLTSE